MYTFALELLQRLQTLFLLYLIPPSPRQYFTCCPVPRVLWLPLFVPTGPPLAFPTVCLQGTHKWCRGGLVWLTVSPWNCMYLRKGNCLMYTVQYLVCAVASVQIGSSLAPLSCVVHMYVCTYIADVWCGRYYQARHCLYHVLCWVTGTLVLCLRLMGLPEGSLWCHVSVQMYVHCVSLYVSIRSVLWLPLQCVCL